MRSTVLTVSLRTDEQSIIKLNEMILLYQVCSNTIVWCVLHKLTNQTPRVSGSMVWFYCDTNKELAQHAL